MGRSIYERNLSLIKRKYPHILEVIQGRDERIIKGEMFVFDEARLKKAEVVLILGFHPEGIRSVLNIRKRIPIVVVEHNPGRFLHALKNVPLWDILKEKVLIGLKQEPKNIVRSLLTEQMIVKMFTDIAICMNLNSVSESPEYYAKAVKEAKAILCSCMANVAVQLRKGAQWRKQTLKNLVYMIKSPSIKALFEAFKDKPAIIVAAGPSLDKNIHFIKSATKKALIMSVDTAFPTLLSHGIRPHIVVSIDSSKIKYNYYFKGKDVKDFYLIAALDCPPVLLKKFEDRLFLCSLATPFMMWLARFTKFKGFTSCGGDVGTATIYIASSIGANPIILTGQDLAYTEERTYAAGVPQEWQHFAQIRKKHIFWVKSVDNRQVMTDLEMFVRIKWIENLIKGCNTLYIDATEGGALKEGTKIMRLEDAIAQYCKEEFEPMQRLEQIFKEYNPPSPKPLLKELRRLRPQFEYMERIAEQGMRLADRMREGRQEQICLMLRSLFNEVMSKERFLFLNILDVEATGFLMKHVSLKDPYTLLAARYRTFFKKIKQVCQVTIPALEEAQRRCAKLVDTGKDKCKIFKKKGGNHE